MRKLQSLFRHTALLPTFLLNYLKINALPSGLRLVCFFPYYQTGGSERVHADILKAASARLKKEEVLVFFTKRSKNRTFRDFFASVAHCFEIDGLLRSKYRAPLLRAVARRVNRAGAPTVFGANAVVLYELIPFLQDGVRVVDLTHSFVPESQYPVERASLPQVRRLAARVVIDHKTERDYRVLYEAENVAHELGERIQVIYNKLNYPRRDLAGKDYVSRPLKVLFVGRRSAEKRIHLIGTLAHALRDEPVAFTLVGPGLEKSVDPAHRALLRFEGEVTNPNALAEFYQKHHLVLIVSRREGFPLVLAEGMAHGTVPVATDVGGIATHVRPDETGFLIPNYPDEGRIVDELADRLRFAAAHRAVLARWGAAAQDEAYRWFDPGVFEQKWREVLCIGP